MHAEGGNCSPEDADDVTDDDVTDEDTSEEEAEVKEEAKQAKSKPEQPITSKKGPLNIPEECAVKVFKTTLNEFKNRDKYIKDDYRFRDRFSKQNPRKVIIQYFYRLKTCFF